MSIFFNNNAKKNRNRFRLTGKIKRFSLIIDNMTVKKAAMKASESKNYVCDRISILSEFM